MRDGVTMKRFSLAVPIHRMIPEYNRKELYHGVRAFWILEVQFGSCGYIGILLVSK